MTTVGNELERVAWEDQGGERGQPSVEGCASAEGRHWRQLFLIGRLSESAKRLSRLSSRPPTVGLSLGEK